MRTHQRKPQGKKEDMQRQLLDLLNDKSPDGADTAAVITEMKRLTHVAATAAQVNDRPLALPAPRGV